MFTYINKYQKGFVLKNGIIKNIVSEGNYFFKTVEVYDINKNNSYIESEKIELLYKNDKNLVLENFYVFELNDFEAGIVYKDSKVIDLIFGGKNYFYFKGEYKIEIEKIDLLISPQIENDKINKLKILLKEGKRIPYLENYFVSQEERGLLIINGKINSILNPGDYLFINKIDKIEINTFSSKKVKLEVSGQELLTKDKYSLRINTSVYYFINDIIKYFENYGNSIDFLYSETQFALRESVSKYTIDEILEKKDLVSGEIQEKLIKDLSESGIIIEYVGIKDIILPGEMKEIMNQVIQAEKTSQVNAIKRRDEVSNVRNLLNTAKLYEDNPMLLKLKEMETLEKVVEKVKNLNITNGTEGLMDFVKIKK